MKDYPETQSHRGGVKGQWAFTSRTFFPKIFSGTDLVEKVMN